MPSLPSGNRCINSALEIRRLCSPLAPAVNQLYNLNKPHKLSESDDPEVGLALDYLLDPGHLSDFLCDGHSKGDRPSLL